MPRHIFEKTSSVPVSAAKLFEWHVREGAFERLSPPWDPPQDMEFTGTISEGGIRTFSVPMIGPLRKRWVAKHQDFIPGSSFVDVQQTGPFRYWKHTHSTLEAGRNQSILQDRIEYELPGGWIGSWIGNSMVRRKLETVFAYRHRITVSDLEAHTSLTRGTTMRILVSGAGGLVGKQLCALLRTGGHEVVSLTRSNSRSGNPQVVWNPPKQQLNPTDFEGFDAVIHLAGENIAGGRWNAGRKAEIRRSRVDDTRLLSETLAGLKSLPRQLICASAIGYYGPRGNEELTETATAGEGFLTDVCRDWEEAADPARKSGISVSNLRFGIILSPEGGALAKMLPPFKMGVGGILGSGEQYMSWITLDDVIGTIYYVLAHPELNGPVNVTAPKPVTNSEFTKTLGKVLKRPTIFPMPAFAARLAFGEMADALLLTGSRVIPEKLQRSGYQFQFPYLEGGLRHLLGK